MESKSGKSMFKVLIILGFVLLMGRNGNRAEAIPLVIPKLINVTRAGAAAVGSPIILVPGDGGSQLEAKLNRSTAAHYLCSKKTSTYYTLWLNLEQLLAPWIVDCWAENMMLVYDNVTRRTNNADGVDIRVPGFGGTETVAWLDPARWSVGQYFHNIIDMAVSLGYTSGKNIRGAPFDFRKAPNEFEEWYENITTLIEETYYQNGNKKVLIVAHSMGNPVMLYFYQTKPQAWKDKFLKAHVSIAAPWGGSPKTMLLFASGYNLDHYRITIDPLRVRPFQRTMTSSAYLMPSEQFWAPNETLMYTEKRNYSAADYKQFFDDIQFPLGWTFYENTKPYFGDYKPPGVEMHCMCGTKLKTAQAFHYPKGAFPDTQPVPVLGDGDGTVPLRSCQGCLRWEGKQKQEIIYKEYAGAYAEHLDLLANPDVVAYVKSLLFPSADENNQSSRRRVF